MDYEDFFELLSDFMDDDMDFDLFDEIEETLLEDEFCYHYFNTFRKTVEICHQIELQEVPEAVHYRIIQIIEHTPQKRKKLPKKRRKQLTRTIF